MSTSLARELVDAHRRPLRSADAGRLRHRVSARRAAVDWRDLGDPDHAAARAGRGAASAGDGRRRGAPQPRDGAPVGPALRRSDGATPSEGRSAGALREASRTSGRLPAAFVVELLQWLRDQPAIGRAGVAGAASGARGAGRFARGDAAARAQREATNQLGDRQHHHQHAAAVVDRLAAVLRARQPGRADPARRSGAAPTAQMDFPTRDRYRHSVEELAKRRQAAGAGGRATRGRARRGGACARSARTIAGITSATT